VASHHFKHGRYTDFFPKEISDRFIRNSTDPKQTDRSNDIGLLTTHIEDLMRQTYSEKDADSFPSLRKLITAFNTAMVKGEIDEMRSLVEQMTVVMEKTVEREVIWEEIKDLVENRRKLVETQRKWEIDMGRMLPVEQAQHFMIGLAQIVKETCEHHISDLGLASTILRDVSAKFKAQFGGPVRSLTGPDIRRPV